ncbi:MAG: ABC transporter permease [Actinobacteria bacterium]|nr:ABC transporter permease [Actinomycetota bacterium]
MATTQERVEEQVALTPAGPGEKHRSLKQDVWRQFKRHKGAMVGLVLLAIVVLASAVGPFVYPLDPYDIDTSIANQNPTWSHPMGTDNLGRDVMARVLIGGRISLAVGFAAMLFGLFLGTAIGVMSGFFKKLDGPLMRVTDLFLALPILPLLLVVIMLFRDSLKQAFGENVGIFILVVFIIGVTSWMQTARVVRGEVLAIKEEEFVLAAHSIGTRKRNVVMRHILPNVLSPVMVSAALGVASAVLTESALSFLGLGFPADFPTWGRLVYDGRNYLQLNAAWVLAPGVLICLAVMSVNFIGDGIRDALDPKARSK